MKKSLFLFFLLLLFVPFTAYAEIEVRFLNVGDADATLVQCDGHTMLVDGGNKSDSSKMYAILKQAGISHLDIVVASHAHADHIGGIPGALNYATADLILCPVTSSEESAFADFEKYANLKGNGITVPNVGDTYPLGNAIISILGVNGASGVNNSSIIMKITYGNTSFLFTGDAEADAEWAAVSSGADFSADVLKVAHHGSDTSTTHAFLNAVQPTFAVISVDTDSESKSPSAAILQRIQDFDAIIYRTDKHGNITFTSDGQSICVTIEKSRFLFDYENDGFAAEMDDAAYIVNTSTGRFHLPECGHVDRIKGKNSAAYSGAREDLLKVGYMPCQVCNP